ncbi:FAD dependent oxidoreductase [Cryomyces antarcticus]
MSNTVIIGAGIIGCSTAYYLSESPRTQAQSIHLVEASPKLFASASGYAGGFLASDWFSPSVAPLGALSFKLHKELADKHDGRMKWGYSRSTGTSLNHESNVVGGNKERAEDWLRHGSSRAEAAGEHEFSEGEGPAWLTKRRGASIEVISEDETVAQVDPLRLSQFLLDQCTARGVQLHHPARAISVSKDIRDHLASVRLLSSDGTETDIPCTRLLIAAGAWTPRAFGTLFPSATLTLPVSQLAGHSLVVRSPRWSAAHEDKGCHAVFATDSAGFSPEIFSRIGGEIYVAGLNDSGIPLPDLPTDARIDAREVRRLKEVATRLLGIPGAEDDLEVVREGLCFRPVTPRGQPILSRIPDAQLGGRYTTRGGGEGGVFVAAGHGPWGISHSLGTGKVMAEMLEGLPTSANVRGLAL